MSNVQTFGTVPKRFQQDAINNGTAVLRMCLTELGKLRGTGNFEESKRLIVADVGALLFEAPTGTGKTLMAGHVAQNISLLSKTDGVQRTIWFWIAPFAGLIEQAIRTIRTEFGALRPKNPTLDRNLTDLRPGDVFVTTWASVAVANESSRKARTSSEELPSIDELVLYARSQGFAIGVVIDEAHHTFRGQTQAFTFYKEVLAPELTILATATPRDRDIDLFSRAMEITTLRRITISRQQAIDERLIKSGVKVAVFRAPTDVQNLVDFKKTALKQAVATHRRIKKELASADLSVVPLMLIQVDSEPGSIDQASAWLKEFGFRSEGSSELFRTHTADEPDPFLSTIAADETVEVLIFKMAVAIGFDAPRAFTLVSFRRSRDENFGIQIVGRILRVDRRLQTEENLPSSLNNGYVFLSDNSGQVGLVSAAQRINAVKDELASVTSNVAVVVIGHEAPSAQQTDAGQTRFFPREAGPNAVVEDTQLAESDVTADDQNNLFAEWGLEPLLEGSKPEKRTSPPVVGNFLYSRRDELGAPNAFRRALLSLESSAIVRDIVNRFRFDDDALLVAQQGATKIYMEQTEIFGNTRSRTEEIRADLAQKEIDARAQQTLFKADDYDVIDIRRLHSALIGRFYTECERRGLEHLFDSEEKKRAGLHKILALRPLQLKRAISETVAQHTSSEEADSLPSHLASANELVPSRLNLYGVFPDDLNTWELPFAEYLDNDLTDTVLWWHRNPVRKSYSVSMPLPGQPDFYPDFVVGIRDRNHGKGILLAETKRVINDQERNALEKAQAQHPDYGKVMMIYWEDKREWRVVEYDARNDSNYLDRVLRPELFTSY